LLTTIQDGGRYGFQKEGIIVSGAMDRLSLRIGNLLVGNQENLAGIEVTQIGPTMLFRENCLLAITGANLSPIINGQPVPMWRPIFIKKDNILSFGRPIQGCSAYISVAGGLAISPVLGSCSTYLRAKLGGLHGRALQIDDCIPFNRTNGLLFKKTKAIKVSNGFSYPSWSLAQSFFQLYQSNPVIRAIPGPEYEWFTEASKKIFWQSPFRITNSSDRMGYHLEGQQLLLEKHSQELLSTAVIFGTIQVPSNGKPILLMADHQTTGGYPRIAQVVSVDLSLVTQSPPGSCLHFQEISLKMAQHLYIHQEKKIKAIKNSLNSIYLKDLLQ
jgi:antagonist of KipI